VQGATALQVLFERLPSLRPEPDFPLVFHKIALLPVRRDLPVRWDPADIERQKQRTVRRMKLQVRARTLVAEDVVAVELAHPDGGVLPAWKPGSHIDVLTGVDGSGRKAQYSLCSAATDTRSWRIAVRREEVSRGASHWLHDTLAPGDTVEVSWPRNHFRLAPRSSYVFIAGGIGITPLLPMIASLPDDADWTLHYTGRSRASMAFLDELSAYGDRVVVWPRDERGRLDLPGLLDEPRPDTAIYVCGPATLIDGVEQAARKWPSEALHVERFAPKAVDTGPNTSFEVHFAASDLTVQVAPEQSILDAADAAGISVLSSCREGTCGTCETPVLSGSVDHRDSVLTPAEQATDSSMMICVSRAAGDCPRLVLGR
jgi:ferredoxin-NADP reductase